MLLVLLVIQEGLVVVADIPVELVALVLEGKATMVVTVALTVAAAAAERVQWVQMLQVRAKGEMVAMAPPLLYRDQVLLTLAVEEVAVQSQEALEEQAVEGQATHQLGLRELQIPAAVEEAVEQMGLGVPQQEAPVSSLSAIQL